MKYVLPLRKFQMFEPFKSFTDHPGYYKTTVQREGRGDSSLPFRGDLQTCKKCLNAIDSCYDCYEDLLVHQGLKRWLLQDARHNCRICIVGIAQLWTRVDFLCNSDDLNDCFVRKMGDSSVSSVHFVIKFHSDHSSQQLCCLPNMILNFSLGALSLLFTFTECWVLDLAAM